MVSTDVTYYVAAQTNDNNDNDDNDDNNNELFLWNGWPTKGVYTLFPAGAIVRDSDHRKSSTHCEQGLNLRRIWVQALLNEVVKQW